MKFSIAVNMERYDPGQSMREVVSDALELVQLAEQGGFEIAWAAEHHTIELTIGPNPFTILTHWAAHTSRIRLGTAVVVAPYWHPIRVAGEAALFDIFSGGRLEFGIGRGAFQYEFDRMAGGLEQQKGGQYLREMLPVVLGLWRGDVAHHGEVWRFPSATSVPKPLQAPHPPVWVATRDPNSFAWAMEAGANIMATPLSRPHAEVGILGQRFADTLAKLPGIGRPRFLMLRRTCVHARPDDWRLPVQVAAAHSARFESLFRNVGEVRDGFAEPPDLQLMEIPADDQAEAIRDGMILGTPDQVVARLKQYQAVGVDQFCYGASFGLPHAVARRSLELFITDVMPYFAT
ncbi:MAG TPA: LLM class flavin-dependent oxidoreductase [Acetobacteraceae bacterium]|jgi:alkanesulfonate monooxygenase SsuD/methylene tetrahydromethanopterin reductase-like flavin-dependent oxidoreductase (luciferase family)